MRADLRALPVGDRSFDIATCFAAIEHVDGQDLALDELRRVLRPDGVLLVSSPNRGVTPRETRTTCTSTPPPSSGRP